MEFFLFLLLTEVGVGNNFIETLVPYFLLNGSALGIGERGFDEFKPSIVLNLFLLEQS
jgi:hypothetical protein